MEREQLERVLKVDSRGFRIENEKLTYFIEMELLDAVNMYGKWEYGKYAIWHFAESFDKRELLREWETKDFDKKILLESNKKRHYKNCYNPMQHSH